MWPYIVGVAVVAAIIGASAKLGNGEADEGSMSKDEDSQKAKAAMPKGARGFYAPLGAGPMAKDKDGGDIFWDGEEWRKPS